MSHDTIFHHSYAHIRFYKSAITVKLIPFLLHSFVAILLLGLELYYYCSIIKME